jgi:hypothetical protein
MEGRQVRPGDADRYGRLSSLATNLNAPRSLASPSRSAHRLLARLSLPSGEAGDHRKTVEAASTRGNRKRSKGKFARAR